MRLSPRPTHCCVRFSPDSKHSVIFKKDHRALISGWLAGWQVSPLYSLTFPGVEAGTTFAGCERVFLLGPLAPWKLRQCGAAIHRSWVTVGLFNLVVGCKLKKAEDFRRWLKSQPGLRYEEWHLAGSSFTVSHRGDAGLISRPWVKGVLSLSSRDLPKQLEFPIREYQRLMMESMSRFETIDTLSKALSTLHESIQELCAQEEVTWQKAKGSEKRYYGFSNLLNQLVNLNFGLNQLINQAGVVTPLDRFRCDQLDHSLLGTGTANLALFNIYAFLHNRVGLARIDKRFEALDPSTHRPPTWDLHNSFWTQDHIGATSPSTTAAVFSQIPYLNGPDHFQATVTTLSVPTGIVERCSSHGWNLLTITHEVSHGIIHSAINTLRPSSLQDLQRWVDDHDKTRSTSEGDGRRLPPTLQTNFLRAAIRIDQFHESLRQAQTDADNRVELDAEQLHRVLARRSGEIEEVMVHAFDFLYFYQGREGKYIENIWRSWSVLPNLNDRLPDYVVRTLCAVLAGRLDEKRPQQKAFEIVKHHLTAMTTQEDCPLYVDGALAYLDSKWEGGLKASLGYFTPILQIVRAFLYSGRLAAEIASDPKAIGGPDHLGNYPHRPLEFDEAPIENPLRWIEFYTRDNKPSAATALWMLQLLAFNVTS